MFWAFYTEEPGRVEGGAYWAASCCPGQVSHLRWQSVSWHHPLHESRLSVTQHDGSLKVYIIIFRRREEEELQVRLLTGEERFEPARVNVAVYSQAQCLSRCTQVHRCSDHWVKWRCAGELWGGHVGFLCTLTDRSLSPSLGGCRGQLCRRRRRLFKAFLFWDDE